MIWHDIVQFVKANGIAIGTGRGAVAGSIVCYILEITKVNPIEYGLIFQRFINTERMLLPDIDMDVDFARCDEVRKYITLKYGKDYVCDAHYCSSPIKKHNIFDSEKRLDILGLKSLGIIQKSVAAIKKIEPRFNVNSINKNDNKVFDFLRGSHLKDGHLDSDELLGVFQMQGEGIQKLMKHIRPDCFSDIVAATAIFRPGIMNNIPSFIKNKHSTEINYIHKKLEPILKETYGIIIYQEQVIKILADIGGFTIEKADLIRWKISKGIQVDMPQLRLSFVTNAIKIGILSDIAEKIFDNVVIATSYAFLKAHAVAYALITFQTAYLSCYYPIEYYTACLEDKYTTKEYQRYQKKLEKAQKKAKD